MDSGTGLGRDCINIKAIKSLTGHFQLQKKMWRVMTTSTLKGKDGGGEEKLLHKIEKKSIFLPDVSNHYSEIILRELETPLGCFIGEHNVNYITDGYETGRLRNKKYKTTLTI